MNHVLTATAEEVLAVACSYCGSSVQTACVERLRDGSLRWLSEPHARRWIDHHEAGA